MPGSGIGDGLLRPESVIFLHGNAIRIKQRNGILHVTQGIIVDLDGNGNILLRYDRLRITLRGDANRIYCLRQRTADRPCQEQKH